MAFVSVGFSCTLSSGRAAHLGARASRPQSLRLPGVLYLQPTEYTRPRMTINVAQHKSMSLKCYESFMEVFLVTCLCILWT